MINGVKSAGHGWDEKADYEPETFIFFLFCRVSVRLLSGVVCVWLTCSLPHHSLTECSVSATSQRRAQVLPVVSAQGVSAINN